MTKTCSRCHQTKLPDAFSVSRAARDGRQSWCRECHSQVKGERWKAMSVEEKRLAAKRNRAGRHADPEGRYWRRMRYCYGLTPEVFGSILESQGGGCAICGAPEPTVRRTDLSAARWAVDHDHSCCAGNRSCGSCVRGILCHACNGALGGFHDDIGRLKAAVTYLQSYERKI